MAYGLVYVLLEAGGEPDVELSDIDEHRSKPRERPTADERPQPAARTPARPPTPAVRYVDMSLPGTLSEAARKSPRQAAGGDVASEVAPRVPRDAARDLATIAETAERGEWAEAGRARARRRA